MSGKPLMTRLEIHGHGPGALALHRMLQREGWEGDTGLRERQQAPDGHTTAQALQAAQASLATRSLALSAGSLQLIKACTGSIPAGSDITCVEVQIGARAASAVGEGLVMRHSDLALEQLGRVVSWSTLVDHLDAKAMPRGSSTALPLGRPPHDLGETSHHEDQRPTTRSTSAWNIRVWADGDPGEDALEEDADQSAIVGRVYVRGAPQGWALERFLADGPLALLPDQSPQSMQLVWCANTSQSESRLRTLRRGPGQSGEQSLLRELGMALPKGIELTAVDPGLQCVRLKRRARAQILQICPGDRQVDVWIANAAQSLHPVAGQGLNLGLRDAAELARCLVTIQHIERQSKTPQTNRMIGLLRRFEEHRQRDRWLLMRITDQLARQSTRFWFQALAPQALKIARQSQLKRFITRTFAFGPREPWPLWA
jgi:2-octaprenyl-6-methoxyphenol hydroxylase